MWYRFFILPGEGDGPVPSGDVGHLQRQVAPVADPDDPGGGASVHAPEDRVPSD